MKKLPSILIYGLGESIQEKMESLCAIEPILAWLGYCDDYDWNNMTWRDGYRQVSDIINIRCKHGEMSYFSHDKSRCNYKEFNVTQIDQIISYVCQS